MRPANARAEPIRPERGQAAVIVYSRPDCHLCADAMAALRALQSELGFSLQERAYFERIPVIALDGEELSDYFLDEPLLRERLESRR
jgi:hypothetical protein